VQLEVDRVVSLHLNGGLLETNDYAADTAQLFGALLSHIKEHNGNASTVVPQYTSMQQSITHAVLHLRAVGAEHHAELTH